MYVSMNWGRVEHNNFGDDLNAFFLKNIIQERTYLPFFLCFPTKYRIKYIDNRGTVYAIGSVLRQVTDSTCIVWGAGLNDGRLPTCQPDIRAVRGPLTRKLLIENGIECPQVYGDPALLLPRYYHPNVVKKFKLGVVIHYYDAENTLLKRFEKWEGVKLIYLFGYKKWTDVIDEILSCERIASSSLHGLVVSEAYKIPKCWVEFQGPLNGIEKNRFKFFDFYASIGVENIMPVKMENFENIQDFLKIYSQLPPSKGLPLEKLLESCPFTLKSPIAYREAEIH